MGTDCSGIEAPIQALEQLKIPYKHVFSSEIDKYCIQSIKANYVPGILFGDPDGPYTEGDIRKRDIKNVPDIDLYVCGFPCQPFSTAGERRGLSDKRGNVFLSCLEIITRKQPKYFMLENVRGLINHKKGETWKTIWKKLSDLKNYVVQWKILNTKDYGIPQSRDRVYIIGTKGKFVWPKPCKCKKSLDSYVDYTNTNSIEPPGYLIRSKLFERIPANSKFVDAGFVNSNFINSDKVCPCLTCGKHIWCVPCSRYASIKELLRLQGFPVKFKQVVSTTQMEKQVGNSMSINVLKALLLNLLET